MDLENIVIDISQKNYKTIQTVQYDVDSRYVKVKIVNNGKNVDLTNYLVSIACKKPDGKIVFNETEMIDSKQGLVKFKISEQISVALGEVLCEFKIYGKNSSVLTTQYFTITVTEPISSKSIQSSNEFRQLTIAMNEYNNWIGKVEEKYNNLERDYAKELTEVKDGLVETNAQLSDIDRMNLHPTIFNFTEKAWSEGDKNGGYEAWANGTVFYDKNTDKHCLVYTSKSSHTSVDGDVYFRCKSDFGKMSKAMLVAKHDTSTGRRCHAAGITKEGYYVALVLHHDNTGDGPLYRYISIDKGQTWTSTPVLLDGVNKPSAEAGSCFLTKTGRLLSYNRLSPSPQTGSIIMRSDNNGNTWEYTQINTGTAPNPLEGNFVQLSNNDIYCIVRGNLYTGDFTRHQDTYITKSSDDGVTWTPLQTMNNIDASFNGVAVLYHEDTKEVEMVYGSRLIKDGYGSIYQRICKEEDFINGNYGAEVKISKGGKGADFGYFGMSKSKNNVVNVFYYNGDTRYTSIYNMVGTRIGGIQNLTKSACIMVGINEISGDTLPSEFNQYLQDESTIIICRVYDNTVGLPSTAKGTIITYKMSVYNGYSRQYFYPSESDIVYCRYDLLNEDKWSEWSVMGGNSFDDNVVSTPITSFSYLKTPIDLFHSNTSAISANLTLDCKNAINNDWFNENCDGVRLEIILKNKDSNNEVQTISFNEHNYDINYQRRIVCGHNYGCNYYMDTWVKVGDKTVNMIISRPGNVQTLIVRIVGVLYKQK